MNNYYPIISDENRTISFFFLNDIREGDLIFLSGNLGRSGYFNKTKTHTAEDWIDILLNFVGSKGTLIKSSFKKAFKRFKKNSKIIFTKKSYKNSLILAAEIGSKNNDK